MRLRSAYHSSRSCGLGINRHNRLGLTLNSSSKAKVIKRIMGVMSADTYRLERFACLLCYDKRKSEIGNLKIGLFADKVTDIEY